MPFMLAIMFGCEREVELSFPEAETQIVVDGVIEQGTYAKVYLTFSFPFFSSVDSAKLFSGILSRAKVTVSTGDTSEVLVLVRNTDYYPPLYYKGFEIKGEVGGVYYLKVEFEGKVLTAVTSIPEVPVFNYLKYQTDFRFDSSGYIYLNFTDNSSQKNYYRTFTKTMGKENLYYPTFINSFDDIYFNGQTVGFQLYNGTGKMTDLYNDSSRYFKLGDSVIVKLSAMDKAHFDFWNSYQGKTLNINSLSGSYSKIISNINGGLGIWGGYASSYYSIRCK